VHSAHCTVLNTTSTVSVSEISVISALFIHTSKKVFKKEVRVHQEGLIRFYILYVRGLHFYIFGNFRRNPMENETVDIGKK
jgi:hypothetical protein